MKRSLLRPGSILAGIVLCGLAPLARAQAPAAEFPMRTFFSVRSAQPDDTIPEVLREQFDKDDGSPLRSVAIDLNNDGTAEKLVLCGVPSTAGGYQWLVYDVKNGTGRGVIIGALIFVGREADGGFARLETYWKQGGNMAVVSRYAFDVTRYGRTQTRALTPWEASEFFRAKGPLDIERELLEIK